MEFSNFFEFIKQQSTNHNPGAWDQIKPYDKAVGQFETDAKQALKNAGASKIQVQDPVTVIGHFPGQILVLVVHLCNGKMVTVVGAALNSTNPDCANVVLNTESTAAYFDTGTVDDTPGTETLKPCLWDEVRPFYGNVSQFRSKARNAIVNAGGMFNDPNVDGLVAYEGTFPGNIIVNIVRLCGDTSVSINAFDLSPTPNGKQTISDTNKTANHWIP